MKKPTIKAILRRATVKDGEGHKLRGISRPYMFEVHVGKLILTGVWLNNTDEKSEKYFQLFVEALTSRDDIETLVED